MVVDDNPANLKLLIDILSSEGYKVRPANGGDLALLSVAAKAPDLILLDIKMPDIDGYEVCRRLKKEKHSCEIPIIFISALDDVEAKVKSFDLGGVDYISKPFQPKEVLARVKNYLQIKKLQIQSEKINAMLMAEISERKLVEESLFKEKERLKITLLSVGDGVISTDNKGKIEIVNEVAQALLGWSQDEASGKYFGEVVHLISAITRDRCEDPVEKVIHTGKIIGLANHTILIAKDGTERHIADSAAPIKDENGDITGVILVFRDVTEEIRKQEEVIKSKEETAFANAANTAKSQFLANMSHEIRTPMNGFLGMIQIMEMTELTQEQRGYMNIVRTSSDALLKLINDILDYTKIEIGKMKLEKIVFNFSKMVSDVVSLFKSSAIGKGLIMEVSIQKDVPDHFIGDPFRLRQILSNLMGNAVKFTNKGRIDILIRMVEVRSNNEVKLEFAVKDTGIGIPDDKIDDLFKSFSQVDNSNIRKYGGSGLGLAISKNLVELMAGEIWVDSKKDEGSNFCFTCVLESIHVKQDFPEPSVKKMIEGQVKNELKILLAEDDPVSQMVLEQLSGRKGWQVILCENGTEAFDRYRKENFDIVIMDCQMPVLDGYKATRAIRQLERQRETHTPIIAMTAYALQGDREKCIEAGMDDYLTKPINAHEFYAAVERWTKKKI
ncbi:response regulator [Pelosinus sp. sgz500959]|uniref:response regulator n=1 Tax=Pelosinus sp. sgz500959 TaxID=3242472 RepID=UPI00367062FE